MSELDHIRQRIEQAELRLRTSHSARERESAALQESWTHIRDKITEQNAEMEALRAQIGELQDAKAELLAMVNTLLHTVENGLQHMRDETVPRIAVMADELLGSETAAAPAAPAEPAPMAAPAPRPSPKPAASSVIDHDALKALEEEILPEPMREPAPLARPTMPPGESLSPGIRDLISRIEDGFPGASAPASMRASAVEPLEDADNELDRDLDLPPLTGPV